MTAFLDTLTPVLPEVIVTITACVVLVADGLLPRGQSRGVLPAMTVVGLALAFLGGPLAPPSGQYFGGFVQIDTFTTFFRAVFIVLAVFATLVAPSYLDRRGIPPGEYYATICFSTVGAMTIALSTDLITLFVGLELMTIPIYVLAGMQRRDRFANEAALKYFLLGAFSSALLVYGFAWLYGVTGSTRYIDVATELQRIGLANGPTIVALALVTVGLGFKAAVVPFHQWTPDAYDGAPTPATAFMSVGPKAAAFAAILRVLVSGLAPLQVDWSAVFAVLAAVTMTGGNIVAAVAASAAGPSATAAVLFYVFAYGVMNLGAFACLLYFDIEGSRGATLEELNGFARRQPLGAFAFAIFLFSLTGIPPTVGFVAKFLVIQPVLDAGYAWLAVFIALNAVLAAFYYLRVVVHMYMYDPDTGAPIVASTRLLSTALGLSALATIVLGVLPNSLYAWALQAANPLLR